MSRKHPDIEIDIVQIKKQLVSIQEEVFGDKFPFDREDYSLKQRIRWLERMVFMLIEYLGLEEKKTDAVPEKHYYVKKGKGNAKRN